VFIAFISYTSKSFDNESISENLMFVKCFLMFFVKQYIFVIKSMLDVCLIVIREVAFVKRNAAFVIEAQACI